jgi:hypothetical protein
MKMKVELNSKQLDKAISDAMALLPEETTAAVHEIAIDLSEKSAERAPIESGDLKNNCHAELNGHTVYGYQRPSGKAPASNNAVASVGYSLPYALRQHEDLALRHDRTDGYKRPDGTTVNVIPGGEAKYLERPFNENAEAYIKRIEKIVDKTLG